MKEMDMINNAFKGFQILIDAYNNLKCCGNCLYSEMANGKMICDETNKSISSYYFCDDWRSDNMKIEERKFDRP